VIEITFPLTERTEWVTIGNKGFQQYRFNATWRGDTVMSMIPDPNNATTGHTNVDGCRSKTYYAETGPGPIYLRQDWKLGTRVSPAQVATAPNHIDWYSL